MRRWLKEIKREEYIEYYIRFDYIIDEKEADKELKMEEFKNAFLSYFLSKNISKDYLIDDDKNICISNCQWPFENQHIWSLKNQHFWPSKTSSIEFSFATTVEGLPRKPWSVA